MPKGEGNFVFSDPFICVERWPCAILTKDWLISKLVVVGQIMVEVLLNLLEHCCHWLKYTLKLQSPHNLGQPIIFDD